MGADMNQAGPIANALNVHNRASAPLPTMKESLLL